MKAKYEYFVIPTLLLEFNLVSAWPHTERDKTVLVKNNGPNQSPVPTMQERVFSLTDQSPS